MSKKTCQQIIAFTIATLFMAGPGFAKQDKDDDGHGKGNNHSQKHEQKHDKDANHASEGKQQGGQAVTVGAFFNDSHQQAARSYYTQQYGGGKGCPPGLSKKNNGCMPPGQAKKWAVGQSLPADVTFYAVPQQVLIQLPPVPIGHKYVRVASDILLVAVGSQMVVDGISGLLR